MADIRAILNPEDHDPTDSGVCPSATSTLQLQRVLPPISELGAPETKSDADFNARAQPAESTWGVAPQVQRAVPFRAGAPTAYSAAPVTAEYYAPDAREYRNGHETPTHQAIPNATVDNRGHIQQGRRLASHTSASFSHRLSESTSLYHSSHDDASYQRVYHVSGLSTAHDTQQVHQATANSFREEPRYAPSGAHSPLPVPSTSPYPMDWEPHSSSVSVPIPIPSHSASEGLSRSSPSQQSTGTLPGSPPRVEGGAMVPSSPVTPPRPPAPTPSTVPPSSFPGAASVPATVPAPVSVSAAVSAPAPAPATAPVRAPAPSSSRAAPAPARAAPAPAPAGGRTVPGSRHSDLQRNRDTSSRHRANKREAHARRTQEIAVLQEERALIDARTQELVDDGRLDAACAAQGLLVTPAMVGVTDFLMVNKHDAFIPFSPGTAELLGISFVSDPVSHVILEFIAIRRGMSEVGCSSPGLTACERARLAACEYDSILKQLWVMPDGSRAPDDLIEARLAEFQLLYHRWDRWETSGGAALEAEAMMSDVEEDEDSEADYAGSDDAAPNGYRRRRGSGGGTAGGGWGGGGGGRGLLGVKRCRRCHVLKTAGSGHRRSHCADGQLVSSDIPFRRS